jgi:hypothetical protein
MDRSGRWEWFQYPLAPVAVFYAFTAIAVPWLTSRGPLKLFAVFMGMWIFWGVMATQFDPASANWAHEIEAGYQPRVTESLEPWCDPRESGDWAGLPFGRTLFIGVSCSSTASFKMLESVGLDGAAAWISHQWQTVHNDFIYHGTISTAYIFLGLTTLFSIVVLPFWAVAAIIYLLVTRLQISWG